MNEIRAGRRQECAGSTSAGEGGGTAKREAVILIRIDNMDTLATEGQRSIRIALTEIGPETIDEWAASALREAPDPVHHPERWDRY